MAGAAGRRRSSVGARDLSELSETVSKSLCLQSCAEKRNWWRHKEGKKGN
jgi:hypothetical protein